MAKKLLNSKIVDHSHKHKHAIEVKDLTFGYEKKSKQLKNINAQFHLGAWTTVLGPNGSGKSTLAKNIVRILKSKNGSIDINGLPLKSYKNKEFAQNVAYIPQMIEIPDGTSVYDFVSFGRNPWLGFTSKMNKNDKQIIEDSMKQVDAWQWKDKMVEDLSGGQRQRVLVAMAMAQTANIIILDEPTTYLDIRAQYELLELMNLLHERGKTIIAILHDINQAVQYSDQIIILKEGEVYAEGVPEKVITEKMLREVYAVETKLYHDNGRKYVTDVKLINEVKLISKEEELQDDKKQIKSKVKKNRNISGELPEFESTYKPAAKKASTAQKEKTTATKSPKTEKSK